MIFGTAVTVSKMELSGRQLSETKEARKEGVGILSGSVGALLWERLEDSCSFCPQELVVNS